MHYMVFNDETGLYEYNTYFDNKSNELLRKCAHCHKYVNNHQFERFGNGKLKSSCLNCLMKYRKKITM